MTDSRPAGKRPLVQSRGPAVAEAAVTTSSDRVRFYRIGGMTIRVESDVPFREDTFQSKFKAFEAAAAGPDVITLRHHFELPPWTEADLGRLVYRRVPWAIYDRGDAWVYAGIYPSPRNRRFYRFAVFSRDHASADLYNRDARIFRRGRLHALTMFPSDQILLARLLADRNGCFVHSSGVIRDGRGLLFVGHSEAGKSTMATMLRDRAEILCDDRIIVRRRPKGYRIYGSWSHGDVPDISPTDAPLSAVFFLEKSTENRALPLTDRKEIFARLLGYLVKPFVTGDWWTKSLDIASDLAAAVPFYTLRFDKSGAVAELLDNLPARPAAG